MYMNNTGRLVALAINERKIDCNTIEKILLQCINCRAGSDL
ncbi:hypothetical protein [Anaerosporobacter sp.]